jgi:hypothetical protein
MMCLRSAMAFLRYFRAGLTKVSPPSGVPRHRAGMALVNVAAISSDMAPVMPPLLG